MKEDTYMKLIDSKMKLDRIVYFSVIIFSILFIYIGNNLATNKLESFNYQDEVLTVKAAITDIIYITEEHHKISEEFIITNTDIRFNAKIKQGEYKNEEVEAIQNLSSYFGSNHKKVEIGDRVILLFNDFNNEWHFIDYVRINQILTLAVTFFILLILFGRRKGFNAIIALAFTCMSIFTVLIPAILSGKNIYVVSIIVCIFSVVSTLLIVIGINKKGIASILGCLGGVFITGALIILMDSFLNLTGVTNQESQLLLNLPIEQQVDLRAIIFASIIIGAVGAIMDVAMSISSSLWEVKTKSTNSEYMSNSIFESGLTIGKDIMGTMINTLVLAYIGSSLTIILLITFNFNSLFQLLNMEMVIVEFLRALVGGFGIFLTIPLTSFICGILYSYKE